ncbi:MAG: hypothetical protein JKP98_00020 [Rhodobacteraceae bacterium]|nr:hypothetical protein [Paracoccaceae bacterium]
MPARITAFLLAAAMAATAATPSAGQSDARIKAQIARIAPGMDTSHLTAADYGAIAPSSAGATKAAAGASRKCAPISGQTPRNSAAIVRVSVTARPGTMLPRQVAARVLHRINGTGRRLPQRIIPPGSWRRD